MQKKTLCFWLLLAMLTYGSACKPKSLDGKAGNNTETVVNSSSTTTTEVVISDSLAIEANNMSNTADSNSTQMATDSSSAVNLSVTKNGAVLPAGAKWGYLNSLELLALMPETKAADQKLEELQRSKESAFKSLMDKYQKGAMELQEKGQDMTRIEQEAKMKEMGELENRLSQMQANSGDEIALEKEKLYAPILKKADKFIKQVGKEQGYEFVLDATALLYADESHNILPAVKKKMGLR